MSRAPELIGWLVPSSPGPDSPGRIYADRQQAEYHAGLSAPFVEPVYRLPEELADVYEPSAWQVATWMLWGALLTTGSATVAFLCALVLS